MNSIRVLGAPHHHTTAVCMLNIMYYTVHTVAVHYNKRLLIFPSPAGGHEQNSRRPGKIKLFQTRESLVSDIPAGNGKIVNLFYSVL